LGPERAEGRARDQSRVTRTVTFISRQMGTVILAKAIRTVTKFVAYVRRLEYLKGGCHVGHPVIATELMYPRSRQLIELRFDEVIVHW